jgi:hypothetical protein
MKKIFYIIFGVTLLLSCDKNDDLPIKKDRGTIEVAYDDEQFKFGEKSYTGIVRFQHENGRIDTTGYFYTSRIRHGQGNEKYYNLDDIYIYGYFNEQGIVDSLRIEYTRARDGFGLVYDYNFSEKPLIISNINYNPETSWLTAEFSGYLHTGFANEYHIYFKKGKISVPMKGLEIPDTYY